MTKISNLSRDLTEEVLSRIPLTSLRRVRSTCKEWNTLSKNPSFAKRYLGSQAKVVTREREFMVVMMMNFRAYLISVNLQNDVKSCIKHEGELVSLDDEDMNVSQVFHCDGLLLCIMQDNIRVVVWNPYCGKPRWIKPTHNSHELHSYSYALGYEKSSKSCRSYKILRFIDFYPTYVEFKIYDINSDTWRVLDVTPNWKEICTYNSRGVSLKGNTYWLATNSTNHRFLVCFDFTRESFGPRLPLPFESVASNSVSISSVRDEQLAVLFHCSYTLQMEIWVTTQIEPNWVSWNSKVFLRFDMNPLTTTVSFKFQFRATSFFIDQEKTVALVLDKKRQYLVATHNIAYIVGEDGILGEVELGVSSDICCYPLACSYVPSLVQL